MDLNHEYAAHQKALMRAAQADNGADRKVHTDKASLIASKIGSYQSRLGAAAACAWSKAQVSAYD